MKINKILIAVFLAVVICVPTMIAISYYNGAQSNPISKQAVTLLKITAPDGSVYEYKKGDKCKEESLGEDLIAYFVDLNSRAVFVSELPELATIENRYTVSFTSYNKQTEIQYYFTTESQYAYLVDQNKTVYRIAEQDAVAFLKSSFSYCLYSASAVPILKMGENPLIPATMLWQYACYDNEFKTVPTQTTQDVPTVTVRGKLNLSFDNEPDYTAVQIMSGQAVVYDGLLSAMPANLLEGGNEYDVMVLAKWFRDEEEGSFGEATYRLHVKSMAPAVFYLNQNIIDPGEFVVLTAKNVEDPSKIVFTSTPSIQYEPKFYVDGEYVRALIPISIALESIPSSFSFSLSYEGNEQVMQLNIKPKVFKEQTYDASNTLIITNRSEAAFREFDNAIGSILKKESPKRYFDDSKFLDADGQSLVRTGFGIYRTLSATGEVYRHEGVDYVIYNHMQAAIATMRGEVVYVGNLALTGKVVVIDHGYGLRSLYAHLDSVSVNVGDVVEKGAELGYCGSTGFTKDLNLHFGLYVQDVPVCPYHVIDYGMQMTEYTEPEA